MFWILECFKSPKGAAKHVEKWPDVPGVSSWLFGKPLKTPPTDDILLNWCPLKEEDSEEAEPKHLYNAGIPMMSLQLYDSLYKIGVENLEIFKVEVQNPDTKVINHFLAFNIKDLITAKEIGYKAEMTGLGPSLSPIDNEISNETLEPLKLYRLKEGRDAIVIHENIKRHLMDAELRLEFVKPENWE